ncbi:MAG: glutamyl-tRNA reductase [Bacteroidota bacterium]
MLANFKIITITHKNVPLKELKNFIVPSVDEQELQAKLADLKATFGVQELLYLATCNRVMYFFYLEENIDFPFVEQFLNQANPDFQNNKVEGLINAISLLEGYDAIKHLLEVASSIDSLVIGERQILKQLRTAFDDCSGWKLTGDHVRLAMKVSVETAKKVYSETRIGEKPVSVVSLAIQKLLKAKFPKTGKLLLVGAGQTNLLVGKFLKKHQFQNVTIFNRSLPRAQNLAELIGVEDAFLLEDLKNYRDGFDGIIVCTGSDNPIITNELYRSLLQGDSGKKLIIDLAIPNNVEKSIAKDFNVNYIEIENLKNLASENLAFRQKEISKAREIIDEQLTSFGKIHQQRQIEKAMRHVPEQIKAVKSHAMNQVFKKDLENLDKDALDILERMMSYMERRCISIPMKAAKESITTA